MATRRAKSLAGGELLSSVVSELKNGWTPGLTVLTGDDLYHLDRVQRALLAALVPPEASEFALTVYGEEKIELSSVVSAARSVGMFAEQRVVLVRELSALDGDPDALTDFAEAPPQNSYLLIRAPTLDKRRKLHKALLTSGRVLSFEPASEYDARQQLGDISRIAKEKELTLDRQAAAFLAQVCLGDLYRVDSELEKVRAWLGDAAGRKVTLDVLREVVGGSGLVSGWEVADAVLARDRGRALAAARSLVTAGDEPIRIVGALSYRARSMLQAKALMERGASAQQAVQAARAWGYRDQLMRGISHYSLEELLGFSRLLLEADRSLKSRSIDSCAVLENLVERMTA